jgi:phosphatidylserine decarboxylase
VTVTNTIQDGVPRWHSERPFLRSLRRVFLQEDLNFLLTNRIPRRYSTLFMGWFSQIESPALTRLSIAVWQLFADDLRLHEAKKAHFDSLQDCFTRALREGARPVDPNPAVVVSPCDAIVGAHGRVSHGRVIQAKGFPYTLVDLLGAPALAERYEGALFVTLRLKSNMYHRFHAPDDVRVRRVRYLSGDTWNVNPITLRRVERLFCKNERAVIELALPDPTEALTLVCVASILVASMKVHAANTVFDLRYSGAPVVDCDVPAARGAELGFFRSGSTIVVFACGAFDFAPEIEEGATVRVGEPLFRRPNRSVSEQKGQK